MSDFDYNYEETISRKKMPVHNAQMQEIKWLLPSVLFAQMKNLFLHLIHDRFPAVQDDRMQFLPPQPIVLAERYIRILFHHHFQTMFMASEDLQESSSSLPINNINHISPRQLVHWLSLYQSFLEMLSTRDLLAFLSKFKNLS